MSKFEVPQALRPTWAPSGAATAELFSRALESAESDFFVLGFNSVVKSLPTLAAVVVFCDAGSLVASLPVEAYLKGVPFAALPAPPAGLLSKLKVKKLSCLGLKRDALGDELLAAAVLAARADCTVSVPFGDSPAALAALRPQALAPAKVKAPKKPVAAQPVSSLPAKRFFSNLE